MAQIFQINGATLTYVMEANWQEQPAGDFLNGQAAFNRWRRHTLRTNVMTAAEFDTLYALEGQKVSLTTTNYANRNGDYITYYDVEIKSITVQHDGPLMRDIQVDCLIRI
jgi:hypothetical protein